MTVERDPGRKSARVSSFFMVLLVRHSPLSDDGRVTDQRTMILWCRSGGREREFPAPVVNDEGTFQHADVIELGVMKGNKGDQNYDVPENVDLVRYRTVTIWCKRLGVNFGSTPLAPV
jgi:hypothetical protein